MESPKIEDWIESELELFGRESAPNRLSASLQIAVLHLLASGLSNELDEESFTGALLGSFCQACRLATATEPPASDASLMWRRHPKNGKGHLSERSTGADFSLIIRHDDNFALAAIFQAKNGQSSVGSFDASHMSPKTPDRDKELQFCRIREHCYKVLASFNPPKQNSHGIRDLDWAHYLVYEPFAIYCSPLSSLSTVNQLSTESLKCGAVRYKEYEYSIFADLLREGCAPGKTKRPGWLSLESQDEIRKFADSALDLFDVYESHVDPQPDWTPLFESSNKLSVTDRIANVKAGLSIPPPPPVDAKKSTLKKLRKQRAKSNKASKTTVKYPSNPNRRGPP